MICWLILLIRLGVAGLKSRRNLLLENLALRHQLLVLRRSSNRPRLTPIDRALWARLSQAWDGWKTRLCPAQPGTVIRWHRAGFQLFWRWKSRPRKTGRKIVAPAIITLIREINRANPLWGAPRIYGELLKLGINLAQRTVANYMVPRTRRPSPHNWKAFLRNHCGNMVSVAFLTVPTIHFKVLYVFLVLCHHRRRVLHFNVVESPSAVWTAQQLREAFAFTSPPKYLLRDRNGIYGLEFQNRARVLGLEEVRIAPRSPWQSPFIEKTWLGAVENLATDDDFARAASNLRANAEIQVFDILSSALRKYVQENNGQFPTDLSQLNPYFSSPIDGAILQRYEILPASSLVSELQPGGDWVITQRAAANPALDSRMAYGLTNMRLADERVTNRWTLAH